MLASIHLREISQQSSKLLFCVMSLKIILLKILHLPGANELKQDDIDNHIRHRTIMAITKPSPMTNIGIPKVYLSKSDGAFLSNFESMHFTNHDMSVTKLHWSNMTYISPSRRPFSWHRSNGMQCLGSWLKITQCLPDYSYLNHQYGCQTKHWSDQWPGILLRLTSNPFTRGPFY